MTGMWACPACGRSFANRNQVHTCAALGPAPGPKPPITGPGRRVGDRLILRGEDLPLPAEVILASGWLSAPDPNG